MWPVSSFFSIKAVSIVIPAVMRVGGDVNNGYACSTNDDISDEWSLDAETTLYSIFRLIENNWATN